VWGIYREWHDTRSSLYCQLPEPHAGYAKPVRSQHQAIDVELSSLEVQASIEEVNSWWCKYDACMFYTITSSVVGHYRLRPPQNGAGTPSLLAAVVSGADGVPPSGGSMP
jgi:hypothetical protein